MNLENVHYDAFISYRHCELDMFVAKNLHKTLEAFKLPAGVAKEHPELKKKIERVFRDQEELPLVSNLAEPIMEALRNSDNLIVICTPRLRESMWCQKEVETFISLHGREHVYAVLAEGEPSESFPPQLLVDENGEPTEPLGADFRGKTNREIKKKMKTESLRLLAPMFGLNYDDLRQRHREQKAKKTISICTIVIAFLLAIGIYSTSMALMIKQQANEIEERNEQITAQNTEIEKQNIEIKEKSHDIALKYALSVAEDAENVIRKGDKVGAVRMLRDVLPDDKNDELLPYTPECERMLADCLGIYYTNDDYMPYECIRAEGKILTLGLSDDGKYLFYGEEGKNIVVCDIENCQEVYRTEGVETLSYYDAVITGHKLFYGDGESTLHCYDIDAKEDRSLSVPCSNVSRVEGQEYIYASDYLKTRLINVDTEQVVFETSAIIDNCSFEIPDSIYIDGNNAYVDITPVVRKDNLEGRVQIFDINTGELKDEIFLGVNYKATSFASDGNMLYIAAVDKNDYSSSIDYIIGYDMDLKKIVYKTKDSNRTLYNLRVVEKEDQKFLFANDDSQPFTFDIETGELLYVANYESQIVDSFQLSGAYETLVMENGEISFYAVDSGQPLELNYFVFPFNEKVYHAYWEKEVFAFHKYASNIIGIYKCYNNKSMEKLDSVPEYHEFSLTEPEIDAPSNNLKILVSTEQFGICDGEGNCIADLRSCNGYDEANNRIIYKVGEDYYAVPVYSYEKLLKVADEYLALYE